MLPSAQVLNLKAQTIIMKLLTSLCLAALLFSSCVPEKKADKYTVIYHASSEPNGLHPMNSSSGTKSHIFHYTQQTLLKLDLASLEATPILLSQLPTVDEKGKVYSYQMRTDATWDDGTPITTNDVLFSVKATICKLTDNATFRANYASVIDSIGLDPAQPKHGFKLYTKEAQWADNLIFSQLYIQPAHIWDTNHVVNTISFKELQDTAWKPSQEVQDFFNMFNNISYAYDADKLYGSGPYKVAKWEKDQYIILERKPSWWGQNINSKYFSAFPQRIVFKVIPDASNAKLAVRNEEIDVSTSIGTQDLLEMAEDTSFTNKYYHRFTDQFNFTYIAFNTKPKEGRNPIFKDVELRRAIAMLTPVEELIETFLNGKATRMIGPDFALKPIFNPNIKAIELDVESAKAKLTQAGWIDINGDGVREKEIDGEMHDASFTLTYMDATDIKEMAQLIKSYLAQAGINMETKGVQFREYVQTALGQDFDAALGSWGGSGSYQNPYQLWHTDSWKNNGANFSGFGNAYSDSLIKAANAATQEDDFKEAYFAFQQEVVDQQPYVFLYCNMRKVVVNKKFVEPDYYAERPGLLLNNLILKDDADVTSPFDSIK